jgi:hypothetical protein
MPQGRCRRAEPQRSRRRTGGTFASGIAPTTPTSSGSGSKQAAIAEGNLPTNDCHNCDSFYRFDDGCAIRRPRRRHTRDKVGPKDLFAVPLSTSHEVGWAAADTPAPTTRFSRKACDETKYMDEIIKSGVVL